MNRDCIKLIREHIYKLKRDRSHTMGYQELAVRIDELEKLLLELYREDEER